MIHLGGAANLPTHPPSSTHAGAQAQETDGANSQLHTIYLLKAADAGRRVCALEKGVIYELESEPEGETKDRVDSK